MKAAGRDILRELSDACKKYDMTMGIYYSQAQDWDDDNAYKKDYEDKNEWKPEFRTYFDEKCKPQLKELLENYDNISLIWFDTPMGMTADEAQELRDWVKGIKPDCIISGRIGHSFTCDAELLFCTYTGDRKSVCICSNVRNSDAYHLHRVP